MQNIATRGNRPTEGHLRVRGCAVELGRIPLILQKLLFYKIFQKLFYKKKNTSAEENFYWLLIHQ